MVTAPNVPDLQAENFKIGDRRQAVIKDNARNQKMQQFAVELAQMVQEANVEFQFVAESRTDITQTAGLVAADRKAVTEAKKAVNADRQHVDEQKKLIDTTAGEVSGHAQQVASDKQDVAQNTQAATEAAGAANDSAGDALAAKNAAEELYGDLDAVSLAKTQSQQAAQTATEQAGLAESSAATATEQAGIATQVAQEANADIDQKLEGYVPRTGADLGSSNLKARLTHNNGYFYIGNYNTSYGSVPLQCWWSSDSNILNMGGATLRNVSVRNVDVAGRKPITNMELVGPSGTDVAESVFALQAGGRSPTIRDDVRQGRASGMYYGLSASNSPDGNGHYFWSGYSSDLYNKFLFIQQNTSNRAWIGGNHNGAWSTPAEIWTNENLDVEVTSDGLKINNGANGGVTIGNRNGAYTHYTSDNGKHYFYGSLHSQSGFYGVGSGLTNLNASNISTGSIDFARVPSTSSRTSSSTAHALNAAAMNAHRTSSDHDNRYYTKGQVDSVVSSGSAPTDLNVSRSYAILIDMTGSVTEIGQLRNASNLAYARPADSQYGNPNQTPQPPQPTGTWRLMSWDTLGSYATVEGKLANKGLWVKL